MKALYISILVSLAINTNGQTGINTSQPLADLHIKSESTQTPILKVSNSNAVIPNVIVSDDKKIGINSLNSGTSTIEIAGENIGKSGIKLTNHQNLTKQNLKQDVAVSDDGYIVLRGNDIGKNFLAIQQNDTPEMEARDGYYSNNNLSLTLPKGKYLLNGILKYYSGSNNDIQVLINATGDASGEYNLLGHYGTFTTDDNAVSFYNRKINSNIPVAVGGTGDSDSDIIGAFINGVITVQSNTTIQVLYKQQSGIVNDTKFFKNSYIRAVKVQ